MCGFVRARMSLAVVRSNTFLLRGARDKEAYILQILDLEDGEVMALLTSCRSKRDKGLKNWTTDTADRQMGCQEITEYRVEI